MLTTLNKKNAKKGFTLTELAIVIAVIAILVAVLVPTFTSILSKAKESNAIQTAKNASTSYTIDQETVLSDGSIIIVKDDSTYYYFVMESGVPYDIADSGNSSFLTSKYSNMYASLSASASSATAVSSSSSSDSTYGTVYALDSYGKYTLYSWENNADKASFENIVTIYVNVA